MRRRKLSHWMLTFYSLPQKYSTQIQKEIHQLIRYNDGGYSWYNVYHHMPVHIRKYHLKLTEESIQKEKDEMEKNKNDGPTPPKGGPNIRKGA